jgi:hypothetical protein
MPRITFAALLFLRDILHKGKGQYLYIGTPVLPYQYSSTDKEVLGIGFVQDYL